MIKSVGLSLALAFSTSVPALAGDSAATQSAFTAHLTANANADQVRKLLAAKDYKNVSRLDRDQDGRWSGTAFKNGKKTFVSVYLPTKKLAPATN